MFEAREVMRIVVTGANGQLGGELCRQLGKNALGLDLDTLDLTKGPAVQGRLFGLKPDLVINCAAYTDVDRAESDPERCEAVNAEAVRSLARACRRLDCPLVQISTDYVFAGNGFAQRPWREDDPPQPRGVYAESKYRGELAAAEHEKHLIVRTCGLYARLADRRARNFVRTMLRLASHGGQIKVVNDQHCTPSYVPHVARAVLFLAGVPSGRPAPWGVYHVTNTGATTWYAFAAEVFRLAGRPAALHPITTAQYGAAAPRPAYSVLDTTKYHRLGGPAMPDWQSALAECFAEGGPSVLDASAGRAFEQ